MASATPSCGIGPGAQLVQEHQRACAHPLHDAAEVFHVRRKRGKGLLDGLLVPDVGKHRIEDRKERAFAGGDLHAELVHERESRPTVFRLTVFPPVLGPVMMSTR